MCEGARGGGGFFDPDNADVPDAEKMLAKTGQTAFQLQSIGVQFGYQK